MRTWFKQHGRWDKLAIATFVVLAVCFIIGGASQRHEFRLTLVEIAALPLLGLVALGALDTAIWRTRRLAVSILVAILVIPLVQLVPLPPQVWGALPGREGGLLALEISGLKPGWAPISVAPDMTWRSFLALIPAAAVFLGALLTGPAAHRGYVTLVLLALAASFAVGGAQVLVGDPFYFWPTTTRGVVSGLFANRNHLATLSLIVLPLAAAVMGTASRRRGEGRVTFWIGFAAIVLAVLTVATTRSRAGMGLLGPALVFSGLIIWTAAGRGRPGPATLGLAGAAGLALLLVVTLGLGPILDRFDSSAPREARFERWPTVVEAAEAYLPVGAGFGTFETVYRTAESLDELDATSFNRAHNEYLEIWLEGGWLSVGVLIAFLVWFGRRTWSAWQAPLGSSADLSRAASVGIFIVLLHSIGDYPLRTVALTATFALLAAILECGATHASAAGRSLRRGE